MHKALLLDRTLKVFAKPLTLISFKDHSPLRTYVPERTLDRILVITKFHIEQRRGFSVMNASTNYRKT